MDKHELFARLTNLTLKFEDMTENFPEEEALNLLAENFRRIEKITDEEAWIVINFLDRNSIEITDGYWDDFMTPIRELAPGWPYGNKLLLKIPVGDGGLSDIKTESLSLFNDFIAVNTMGLPLNFKPADLKIEGYWGKINWEKLSESEFRFILIVICNRGKKVLDSLKYNSSINLAIERFKDLDKLEKK